MRGLVSIVAAAALLGLAPGVASAQAARPAATAAPAPATDIDYVVKPGDTLIALADQYLVRPADYLQVARLNRIRDPRRLPVGRTLRLPIRLLKTTPAQARVSNVRGAATIEVSGASSAAAVGQMIGEGAVISTGANTFLRIALPDGGHVTLPSRSRVRVRRLRTVVLNGATDQFFDLEAGRVESQASPVIQAGGFAVGTPISVSAVRGTTFRTSFDDDTDRSGTEVIEGLVGVAAGDTDILAAEAQGVAAGPEGAALAPLPAAPELVRPDDPLTAAAVTFEMTPVPGAVRYRARLATDAGMVDAFAEADSAANEPRVTFESLEDGFYFVRLSAISAEGLEGLTTVYGVVRARSGMGAASAGPIGSGRDRHYLFRWETEGDGPAEFRFQLVGPDSETPLIDEAGLTESRITLAGLPGGEYTWRVRTTRQKFGRTIETWSDPQTLRIGGR